MNYITSYTCFPRKLYCLINYITLWTAKYHQLYGDTGTIWRYASWDASWYITTWGGNRLLKSSWVVFSKNQDELIWLMLDIKVLKVTSKYLSELCSMDMTEAKNQLVCRINLFFKIAKHVPWRFLQHEITCCSYKLGWKLYSYIASKNSSVWGMIRPIWRIRDICYCKRNLAGFQEGLWNIDWRYLK